MELSRIGVELQEKRDEKEIKVMWNQIWSLCFAVVVYASLASIWGSKIIYLVGAILVGIVIYRFNRIQS